MDDSAASTVGTNALELKQHGRNAKNLKHKSKNKRAAAATAVAASSGGSDAAGDDKAAIAGAASDAHAHHHHRAHHHHHHSMRHARSAGNAAASGSAAKGEDVMRELLTSKIAELQVGGDENLETPIDLSGIYQDEALPAQTLETMQGVLDDGELGADAKVDALAAQVKTASDQLAQLQQKIGELNAKCILLKQRKQTATTELVKTNATKSKLEQLCRELQKQNKLISESRRIADEEDQKRRELSTQFQKTIEEVSAKMDQQGKDYVASLKENESLQQKLKSFLEQYTVREEHFQKQLEAKDLTVQLADAKLQHQVEITARESEKVKLALDKAKEFSDRELQLQAQLNSYSEKFDIVQETLNKSNQMFTTFRDEMDKMAKHTKKLEKENTALKKKCAEYDTNAIATIQDKVKTAEETQKYLEKIKKLESLCRHLQAERNSIREGKPLVPESA
uniref:Alpha-taxilin n=1 Tax=Globisporangium ultimum (strain ATCC 200006 / CBS 805.95 / DAOM BR144) TaxID=431595 RepID=K3X4A8_GLOUD